MIGVHAQQYGKDRYDDKESYGKENSYYKSEDSSNVNVKKIECNNINTNLDGFNGVELGTLPTALSGLASDEAQVADEGEIGSSSFESGSDGSDGSGRPSGSDSDFKVVCIYNNITPEPVKDPILTVKKEMFICEKPKTQPGSDVIDCIDDSTKTIPGPESTVWKPWDDCTVTDFCQSFDEADFLMQIEQNSGPFEFPGNSDGQRVIVESGTFQVKEKVDPESHHCENTNNEDGYEEGTVHIVHGDRGLPEASFCIILEGDCSGTIQAGEEKKCTVNNYFFIGRFLPQTGNSVNGATTGITTQSNNAITTQSNNAITTQSNNAITTTPITTQSSNVGAALQSNDVGSTTTQSSNVAGVPNTFSSSFSPPPLPLLNILPSIPK